MLSKVNRAADDAKFMARALFLARKGLYTTEPNPRVGCVLVKDNHIIAEGWHVRTGEGHAEVEALRKTDDAQGATAYVTLEPCSHYGKTPPCAMALIEAGIQRVVIAMQDPNPLVAGKGILLLQQADIEVSCGVLEPEAQLLNKGFIRRMQTGLPYVISKIAMSLDGKTAMASGESKWITSTESRQDVQRLRASSSAIMTGVNTILADDPSLNVRLEDVAVSEPLRIILDSSLKTPSDAKLFSLAGRVLILTCVTEVEKYTALQSVGAEVYCLADNGQGQLDLLAVLKFLGEQQVNQLLIEAGSLLNGAMLQQGLIDECIVYMAPCVLGTSGRGVFAMPMVNKMADKKSLQLMETRQVGVDLRLHYKVQK